MRSGIAIAGASLFGGAYLISATGATTAVESTPEVAYFYIPVAGPFVMIGVINGGRKNPDSGSTGEGILTAIVVVDGLIQAIGATMFIVGVASDRKLLVRNDVASRGASRVGDSRAQPLSIPDLSIGLSSASLRWQF
jgi:hypothetical protein